jgi:zinc transport system ATP-binding protein
LQRVLLALALEQRPDILILDEPAAGVDLKGGQICCELLSRFRKERGFTQLMVSHDLATVAAHATHVICLNKSVQADGPVKETLTPHVLAATFGLHGGVPDVSVVSPFANPCHCQDCERIRGGER